MRTALPSAISSLRTASVNPRTANLAPQYALCNGMPRKARDEPTLTITPRSRAAMRRSAAAVPLTCPR